MTIAETCLAAGFARLEANSPPLGPNIRRFHRVPPTREDGDSIYWIDGDDGPASPQDDGNSCNNERRVRFTVSLYLRDDSQANVDDLKSGVNDALSPTTPYGDDVTLHQGAIRIDTEIADEDATKVDMEYEFRYATNGWTL